jgi:hypothetical protein
MASVLVDSRVTSPVNVNPGLVTPSAAQVSAMNDDVIGISQPVLRSISVVCDALTVVPDAGIWSPWQQWSGCSATCGGGSRQRTRTCQPVWPQMTLPYCDGLDLDSQPCNLGVCGNGS